MSRRVPDYFLVSYYSALHSLQSIDLLVHSDEMTLHIQVNNVHILKSVQ